MRSPGAPSQVRARRRPTRSDQCVRVFGPHSPGRSDVRAVRAASGRHERLRRTREAHRRPRLPSSCKPRGSIGIASTRRRGDSPATRLNSRLRPSRSRPCSRCRERWTSSTCDCGCRTAPCSSGRRIFSRYPAGALRPLVLYRLGWAYRSTEAAGLPRKSGNEAFAQLRRECPGSPLSALAAEAHGLDWKSKDAATGWSVVPGLGQMYAGAYGQGSVHLLVALAAATMMVAPVVVAYERRHDLTWGDDWPLLVVGVGGLLVQPRLHGRLPGCDQARRRVE